MASARRFPSQPRGAALLMLFLLASSLIGMAAGDPDKAKAKRKVCCWVCCDFCCCCCEVLLLALPLSLCWCWSGSLRRSMTQLCCLFSRSCCWQPERLLCWLLLRFETCRTTQMPPPTPRSMPTAPTLATGGTPQWAAGPATWPIQRRPGMALKPAPLWWCSPGEQ